MTTSSNTSQKNEVDCWYDHQNKIIKGLIKYLEKNGKEKDTYWRLRCREDRDTDYDFSTVFFKGNYFLATLKAYRHHKIDKDDARNISYEIMHCMDDDDDCTIEKAVKTFMKHNYGNIFGTDWISIERISTELEIL